MGVQIPVGKPRWRMLCLADYGCDGIELFAAFLPGHPVPPRIRLFVDFMATAHLS